MAFVEVPHKVQTGNVNIILGSTSPFRRELLDRLGLPFSTDSPQIDETPLVGEPADTLVGRIAEAKAREVGSRHSGALVIGSDQVAAIGDSIFGKPGGRDAAIRQLVLAAGKIVTFHTGLCLLNTDSRRAQILVEHYKVHFRQLSRAQITRYVDREKPFNCAGSFKSEGLGITLFSRLEGRDPNTLIGLPLIGLVEMLDSEGIQLP